MLLAVGLILAGCARQPPPSTSPSVSPTGPGPVTVASTAEESSQILAELYVQGLAVKGRAARIVELADDPNTLVSRLGAGEVDMAPVFAWSAAQGLQVDTQGPDTLVSDLAGALDGEVAVLQASKIDRAWRFVSNTPGVSLDKVPTAASIVAPTRWTTTGDGENGLRTVYQATAPVRVVNALNDRLQQVQGGAIGVFEATDPQVSTAGLEPVADPRGMVAADPQVAFLRLELAQDDTVLDVVQQLHAGLSNDALIGIKLRAAAAGKTAAVTEWLQAHPLT